MTNFFKTKSIKPTTVNTTFALDFTRFIAPATVASITTVIASTGLTIVSSSLSGNIVSFLTNGGTANTEYLITITIVDSNGNTVVAYNVVFVTTLAHTDYYGNTFTDYFTLNLNNAVWASATMTQKISAMLQATRAIERLNFVGNKLVSTQPMQFPRNSIPSYNVPIVPFPVEYDYPDDVEFAVYEEALLLLSDPDTQTALSSLNVIMEQLGAAKVQYDRSYVPANERSGIMSVAAWDYLKPYLRDWQEVDVLRCT